MIWDCFVLDFEQQKHWGQSGSLLWHSLQEWPLPSLLALDAVYLLDAADPF